MPQPNIPDLVSALEDFDAGPCTFTLDETRALKRRIYHVFYYKNRGWITLMYSREIWLARMLHRIKGFEDYLLTH